MLHISRSDDGNETNHRQNIQRRIGNYRGIEKNEKRFPRHQCAHVCYSKEQKFKKPIWEGLGGHDELVFLKQNIASSFPITLELLHIMRR